MNKTFEEPYHELKPSKNERDIIYAESVHNIPWLHVTY